VRARARTEILSDGIDVRLLEGAEEGLDLLDVRAADFAEHRHTLAKNDRPTHHGDSTAPKQQAPGLEHGGLKAELTHIHIRHWTSGRILLITVPPLVMFLFFNRKIVAGLTAGGVKG
jgi:hypothetical protein